MNKGTVDPELLEILACPETKEEVRVADEATLQALNEKIQAGKVATRGGKEVTDPLDGGLVRADGKVLYPVRDGIPIMLIDESIQL